MLYYITQCSNLFSIGLVVVLLIRSFFCPLLFFNYYLLASLGAAIPSPLDGEGDNE